MRVILSWVAVGALAFGCGSSSKTVKGPTFAAGTAVRITDAGQIFDALNTTSCIKWPSPQVKQKAGRGGWKGFEPGAGLEGKVVAALAHCDGRTQVVLVEVGNYVVPVTSKGVEDATAKKPVDGGAVAANPGEPVPVGQLARIINDGALYDTIADTDCVSFPSADAKARGGVGSWDGWHPANGSEGVVIGYAKHCDGSTLIAFLELGGYVVPMGATGIEAAYPDVGYGGFGDGGVGDGSDWGVVGGVVGGDVYGGLGTSTLYYPGDTVQIVRADEIYAAINTGDCMSWPSQELKAKGGQDAWGSYYPAEGDIGTVVGNATHCSDGEEIVILDVNGNIVPINSVGVAYYCPDC